MLDTVYWTEHNWIKISWVTGLHLLEWQQLSFLLINTDDDDDDREHNDYDTDKMKWTPGMCKWLWRLTTDEVPCKRDIRGTMTNICTV